jgi:nicotinate phosphoribosyltransferase
MPDHVRVISLVDFRNDCVRESLAVARALGDRLHGVRLDTSGNMVDASVQPVMGEFDPLGVNPRLVRNVRGALDREGFSGVRIVASGGFDADKIRRFKRQGVPVDAYGVGSALIRGRYDFTADVVLRDGENVAKTGRRYRPNARLERVR